MATATPTPSPSVSEAPGTPPLLIHPSTHSLLTARVQATLERLLELLQSTARTQGVPVSKIEVHGFVDPEEDGVAEFLIKQEVGFVGAAD